MPTPITPLALEERCIADRLISVFPHIVKRETEPRNWSRSLWRNSEKAPVICPDCITHKRGFPHIVNPDSLKARTDFGIFHRIAELISYLPVEFDRNFV